MLTETDQAAADVPQARLFELIWQETSALRRENHGGRGCPTALAPYGERDPRGAKLADACLAGACMDLVHDIYISIKPRLDEKLRRLNEAGRLGDAVRYAHSTIKIEVVELGRRWRVARGLPAKPSRSDGVPGRVNTVLAERAEDTVAGEWYNALFRMMRSYVCRPGAPGRGWPLDGWAQEKSKVDTRRRVVGGQRSRREIRADIAWVLSTAVEVAGSTWVHENITGSLQISSTQLSLDAIETDYGPHPTVKPPDEDALVGLARSEFAQHRGRGVKQEEATRAALTNVYGIAPKHVPDDAVRRVADSLGLELTT